MSRYAALKEALTEAASDLVTAASDLIATLPSNRPWTKEEQALVIAFQRAEKVAREKAWCDESVP